MINYYQPFLWPFLGLKQHLSNSTVTRMYYHSFEDALWDFLKQKQYPKGSVFLIPDFYCMDVVQNIENHGFRVKLYPLDQDLQPEPTAFWQAVNTFHPDIVVLFHACGMSSNLLNRELFERLPKQTVVIEDAVHRLINPSSVKLLNDRHVLMDSLRKDTPLSGSFIYGTKAGLHYRQTKTSLFSWYFFKTAVLYLLFRCCLMLGQVMHSTQLIIFAHEKLLRWHDDVIGDVSSPQSGWPFVPFIHRFFDIQKVERLKERQVMFYDDKLRAKVCPPWLYEIKIPSQDRGKLHVFPVGLQLSPLQLSALTEHLHRLGIVVWPKFLDAPWSLRQQVLFLPLGFHISDQDITFTIDRLLEFHP